MTRKTLLSVHAIPVGLLLVLFFRCLLELATEPKVLFSLESVYEASTSHLAPINNIPNNWTSAWLDKGIHGERARILLVHVGKTGGVTLIKGIPVDVIRKKRSLTCLMKASSLQDQWLGPSRKINKNATTRTNTHSKANSSFTALGLPAANLSTITKSSKKQHLIMTVDELWAKCYPVQPVAPALGRYIFSHKHLFSAIFTETELTWVLNHVNTFLVTIRSPVARIVSAFNYHRQIVIDKRKNHNRNSRNNSVIPLKYGKGEIFLLKCFESVDHLAEELLHAAVSLLSSSPNMSSPSRRHCIEMARNILQGKARLGQNLQHLRFNYQVYESETIIQRPSVPVVVVRTEQLWQDAKRLDQALGGNGTFARDGYHYSHGSENYTAKKESTLLTGKSTKDVVHRQVICCQIYLDIASYQRIVLRALNLNHAEKADTLQLAFDECGVWYTRDPILEPFNWNTWHKQSCVGL